MILKERSFLRYKACDLQVMWLTACTAVVGYVPEGSFKRWLNYKVSIMCFGVLSSALSSVITYHNPENRPVRGICVANHTSPIDVLILMCDNCYSLVRFCRSSSNKLIVPALFIYWYDNSSFYVNFFGFFWNLLYIGLILLLWCCSCGMCAWKYITLILCKKRFKIFNRKYYSR